MVKLLQRLGLHRPGVAFYALRHTFETIGGGSRDQIAVNHIMGHADDSMAAVGLGKVLAFIRSGELRAINIASDPNGKPQFLIDVQDVADFEAAWAVVPATKLARRRKNMSGEKQYF